MANYNVDIAVAVKNTQAITQLSDEINQTGKKIDIANEKLQEFGDNIGKTVVNSVRNFSNVTKEAAQRLNDAALGSREATRAARQFVRAVDLENEALRQQTALLAEVRNQGKSGTLRGGTQHSNPLGPFQGTKLGTDQALVGQSSAVGGRVERLRAVQADDIRLQEALFNLNKKTAQEKNNQVDAQEALVRGANEVKALAAEARGETISSSIDNRSPARRQKEDRTRRAEDIAKEAALKSNANQKEFAALKKFQDELFNIDRTFIRKLRTEKIDAVLAAAKTEGEKQDELFQRVKRNNKEGLDDFDRRLKASVEASADRRKARIEELTLTGQSSPVRGAKNIPGSPVAKEVKIRRQQSRQRFQNLALGAGFPLLFGGGAGSIAGGLAGSAGGFGGQILGSAIGQIVDQAVGNIAELGKALSPFTANIKAVTAAAGESGTAFERLVDQLEEVAGEEKALEVATAQLATIIGSKGVDALKEFGDASSDLSNELSKALTALGAALAPVLADITRAAASAVEKSRLVRKGTSELRDDPGVQQIRSDLSERKIGELEAENKIAELVREKELEEQISIAKKAQADIQAKINEKTSSSITLTEQKLVIEQNGGDILNEQVQTALQNIDAEKIRLMLVEAQGDQLKINLAFKESELLLAIRTAKIEAAAERKKAKEQREAETAARKAARDQEARDRKAKQLQQSIFDENFKQLQIYSEFNQLHQNALEAIETQKEELLFIQGMQTAQIKIEFEDLALQKEKLETLQLEGNLQLVRLERAKEELILAEKISELQAANSLASAARGLEQERDSLVLGESNSSALEREQGNRFANTLAEINAEIQEQNLLIEETPSPDRQTIEQATKRLGQLEEEAMLYRKLLPEIFAAEEAQMKFNNALAVTAPVVDSLFDGLTAVVAGTKSAEEAFADFLRSISDMLMDTVKQMIAQYIALAIARSFGMGEQPGFNLGSTPLLAGGGQVGGIGTLGPNFGFAQFANGGPLSANQPSIIGERGPELFIPFQSGRVVSNEMSRASSSQVPFTRNVERVTQAQETAAAMQNAGPIDVRYESQVINNVEYVTAEEYRQGMTQAAERGKALTLSALQNRPAIRSQVGIR